MDQTRTERLADIVESALEHSLNERAQFVTTLCGDDVDLRREVESLLAFDKDATDFIEKPAYQMAANAFVETRELKSGEMFGSYKIISLIGEGGMGEVYLAEDTSLGRKVAIKLLKFGLGTLNIIRRFHQEERILAGLTHPNIARLYGGDVTANGLPYFVMEYVEGARLDDFCRDNQLSILQRLELFRKVCAAVSYAHHRLVIHRDIKPANIRVTADGEPKLLDFGIAKLLDPGTAAIEATMTFAAVMTPEYASPEQVRGEHMTTASDVYSLGVLLYELLTEQKPYKIDNRAPTAMARAVTEQEPTKPSTAVSRSQRSEVRSQKVLRGDLDNIVMKALRKEPERRYASVGQFADDIGRYLDGRPISARKDTLGYRASKFIARNRIAAGAGILILLAIIGALIVSLWQTQNARHERDVAERERLKAQRINTFLQDMLGSVAPEKKGYDVKVVDVLSEASARAIEQSTTQGDIMADVLLTLGYTYIAIGQYDKAEADLRAAVAASTQANGELHRTTASSLGWLGLALAYQIKPGEGEEVSRKAVALQRQLHPNGHEELGYALYALGFNLIVKGDAKSAQPHLREAVDLSRKYLGEKHGYFLAASSGLGLSMERSGDLEGAKKIYRDVVEVGRRGDPRYRIYAAQAASYLGGVLTNTGDYANAEKVLRESESLYREILGENNSNVGLMQMALGRLYFRARDYAKAKEEYSKALPILSKSFTADHPVTADAEGGFGMTLTRGGEPAIGEPHLRTALAIRKKVLPAGDVMIPFTESALGECLTTQKRYREAEPLLLSGYDAMKSKLGETEPRVAEARQRLATLYESWGKSEEAARYR